MEQFIGRDKYKKSSVFVAVNEREHAERDAALLMAYEKWAYPNKSTLSYGPLRQPHLTSRSSQERS
jgi:hypothetical protein